MARSFIVDGDPQLLFTEQVEPELLFPESGEVGIFTAIRENIEPYAGPYVVDPLFRRQVLATNGKKMESDVTVNAIYVSRVSNPQGGDTAFIGGEFIYG